VQLNFSLDSQIHNHAIYAAEAQQS
jgi:hypothetical protein